MGHSPATTGIPHRIPHLSKDHAMNPSPTTATTIDHLNTLVRRELSAVETYGQAIAALAATPIPELDLNCNCHARRVRDLSELVTELGGSPPTTPGFWGAISGAIADGASVLGRRAILTVLTKGEEQGLEEYHAAMEAVDEDCRLLIERDLIPSQQRAYDRVFGLSHSGPPTSSDLLGAS
jgi:hypothetical protein